MRKSCQFVWPFLNLLYALVLGILRRWLSTQNLILPYRPIAWLLLFVFLMRPLNLLMRPLVNDSKISTNVKKWMRVIIAIREQTFPTGFAHVLLFLIVSFRLLYDVGVFKFVCFTEISRKGAINVIAVGISCVNALILSFFIVVI